MSTEVILASCLNVDHQYYIFIFPNWGVYLLYMQKKGVDIFADNYKLILNLKITNTIKLEISISSITKNS